MLARVARALAVLAVVAAAATGCVGSPEPQETTPTPLTDEQAFAAAEETYRAYVDALNQVDLSDPATFEPVYALTTGDANASARESFTQMHADGWTVTGESVVTLVEPAVRTTDVASVDVCVDVSAVSLTDSAGQSVVSAERPDIQALTVEVSPAAESIVRFVPRDGEPTCGS
ncbi:hypothetical protein [Microbacterium lushaniae]|uniref:SnoaL-like domain-containing protein n=1 Tax=Microbacterium lushaniae TaxID=2614639 RepID=A0A5J6L332_9MICO|nr:hypothetical protein [Microbacterium lushaniae]QEW02865.1 hypothetical protein F6J85_06920 [Microbacterium lushaniae]